MSRKACRYWHAMLSLTYGYGSVKISFYTCLSYNIWQSDTIHIIYITIVNCNTHILCRVKVLCLQCVNYTHKPGKIGLLWFEHNNSSTQMRRLTSLALTRLFYLKCKTKQRISDSNGCGNYYQISFKLIALDHSANSLACVWFLSDLNAKPTLIKSILYQLS